MDTIKLQVKADTLGRMVILWQVNGKWKRVPKAKQGEMIARGIAGKGVEIVVWSKE